MAASRLGQVAEAAAEVEIERLIPHQFVAGPKHGQSEGDLMCWDQHLDAQGQEAMLMELERRGWDAAAVRRARLAEELHAWPAPMVTLVEDPFPDAPSGEQNLLVLFSAPAALGRVRLTSFLDDCLALAQPIDALRDIQEREVAWARCFVEEQHRDLQQTFDPKVAPLRKRRSIMMSAKTFHALS